MSAVSAVGVISVLITLAFGTVCIIVIWVEVPEGSRALANVVFGVLGTAFITVVNYWMGTSRGSAAKDQTISELAKK